jgi:hypothetical protein
MTHYSPQQGAFFAHKITLEGLGEETFAQSLSTARVDMNPHQIDAALFALSSPLAKGVLLADEVGLGKTIEAALVIAQKWAERRRRILLIVPASLRVVGNVVLSAASLCLRIRYTGERVALQPI